MIGPPIRGLRGGLFLAVALGAWSMAAEPPEDVRRGLEADAYPERIAAERQLEQWAEREGEAALDWLARQAVGAKSPELRLRARRVLRDRIEGQLDLGRPGFVGISMATRNLGDGRFGIQISGITPDSPAQEAGLERGDVIASLNGEEFGRVDAQNAFAERIGSMRPGTRVRLGVMRGGDEPVEKIELELAARPWSIGSYGRVDPEGRPATEREARDEAFREWLRERLEANPG